MSDLQNKPKKYSWFYGFMSFLSIILALLLLLFLIIGISGDENNDTTGVLLTSIFFGVLILALAFLGIKGRRKYKRGKREAKATETAATTVPLKQDCQTESQNSKEGKRPLVVEKKEESAIEDNPGMKGVADFKAPKPEMDTELEATPESIVIPEQEVESTQEIETATEAEEIKTLDKRGPNDVEFVLRDKHFFYPKDVTLNPNGKYCLVCDGGNTYHSHLGCYLDWPEEYRTNFNHWDVITTAEAKKQGYQECRFCEERRKTLSAIKKEVLLSGRKLVTSLTRNHSYEEVKIFKSGSASRQEAIELLSVGDELTFNEDENCDIQVESGCEVIGYISEATKNKLEKKLSQLDSFVDVTSLRVVVSDITSSPSSNKKSVSAIALIEDPYTLADIIINIVDEPESHCEQTTW